MRSLDSLSLLIAVSVPSRSKVSPYCSTVDCSFSLRLTPWRCTARTSTPKALRRSTLAIVLPIIDERGLTTHSTRAAFWVPTHSSPSKPSCCCISRPERSFSSMTDERTVLMRTRSPASKTISLRATPISSSPRITSMMRALGSEAIGLSESRCPIKELPGTTIASVKNCLFCVV